MHPRKTTPRVRNGKVQKKNNQNPTPNYFDGNLAEFVIDRERPGEGYRHILMKRDVETFISILPDWPELSVGLSAIVMAKGEPGLMGWHTRGVVGICAWERDLWDTWTEEFHKEHSDILARLGVPCEEQNGDVLCRFTEDSVRSFQLLHIFLHEMGHHHDRMTTQSQRRSSRGEGYAESYARRYEAQIFSRYTDLFPLH